MHVLIYGFSGKILGGIETFILNMNEHMSPDTIFDYIIDGDECVYRDRIEHRGGNVFFVPGVRKNPLHYIKEFRKVLREQKINGTKVLYIQLFSMANMLPAILAKEEGYKVILHAHNNGLQNKNGLYKIIHLLGKHLTRYGDYVRFTNSSLSSDFMFGKGIKSELIYNAIDTDRFSFHQEIRDKVRAEQNCGNKIVIGFVGRLMLQKNPVFMIRVFSELLKMKTDCELWIIGEGELKNAMLQAIDDEGISSSVKWLGRRNDVEQLMQGMDLLLQPSLFEGLGIVLIEAQSSGLPVVSTADVVPIEAKASDRICFVKLDEKESVWADTCINMLDKSHSRSLAQMPEYYQIDSEAKRLEGLLIKINSGEFKKL